MSFELFTLVIVIWVVVLGSIAENFRQSCKAMTERMETALRKNTVALNELEEVMSLFLDRMEQ